MFAVEVFDGDGYDCVEMLLKCKADPNAKTTDATEMTPLLMACEDGIPRIVRFRRQAAISKHTAHASTSSNDSTGRVRVPRQPMCHAILRYSFVSHVWVLTCSSYALNLCRTCGKGEHLAGEQGRSKPSGAR